MRWPEYPEAIGVFRSVRKPTYDEMLVEQIDQARSKQGPGSIKELVYGGERWRIDG
jgi:2-oxoglutarate ferredoxin oxidoreductase subunit beta